MITVFGSINLDLVVVVERLPFPGETIGGSDHQTFAGGKGANQALAAKKAGAIVKMIGAVGQDGFSQLALANLVAAEVDLSGVRSLEGATGIAMIGVDAKGENQIIFARGANARADADWLKEGLGPDDTLMLQGEAPFQQIAKAMQVAKQAQTAIFWNLAPVPRGDLGDCLDLVSTLVVNESEAAEIARRYGLSTDLNEFLDHFETPSRAVVATLGAAGVIAIKEGKRYQFASPAVKAVDTTGAGDAFCGALAAALDRNVTFERAVKEGVAAGALACTLTGAQSSAPLKSDIEHLADQIV
jgi:ribokinase